MRQALAGALAAALWTTVAADSAGDPPQPDPPNGAATVTLHASPIFGPDAASGYGWTEVLAHIDNAGSSPQKGVLELSSSIAYGGEQEFTTRASFNVPAGRSVVVHLPTHGFPLQPASLALTASNSVGAKLASQPINVNPSTTALLVDVDEPSRLANVLRNAPIAATWSPSSYGGGSGGSAATALSVGAASFDRATGDPILPNQAAGYAAVTVVVIHSDTLVRVEAAPLDALVDWVLSGGTLAVVPTRPEDLRGPTLSALVGGVVSATDAPSVLLALPAMPPASLISPFAVPAPSPSGTDPQGSGGTFPLRIGPSPAVRARLSGYTGGNLHPSHFGASAPYGTGEVHLLAFDPTTVPAIDDSWAQARVAELVAHAWDRRATNAFRQGTLPQTPYQLNEVRRSLDPNENFRPALGVAAVLLVLYSIVAGPLTFLRAAKSNNPLGPLKWAPIWSATAFAGVVLIGLAGKGWRGRARHLSLIEARAGMSRGSIRRFRGFFTSEARAIGIATTDPTCVLDVMSDESSKARRALRIDRGGGTLENLTSLPWQTAVVVEDGFADIGGGVSISLRQDGTADVTNATGHALRDVVVYVPGKDNAYFAGLGAGASVNSSTGRKAGTSPSRRSTPAGSFVVHPLNAADLGMSLEAPIAERLRESWQPLESAAGPEVDWWPDQSPVVLAEIVGGEGRTRDADLAVESDHAFLRVVGTGAPP